MLVKACQYYGIFLYLLAGARIHARTPLATPRLLGTCASTRREGGKDPVGMEPSGAYHDAPGNDLLGRL